MAGSPSSRDRGAAVAATVAGAISTTFTWLITTALVLMLVAVIAAVAARYVFEVVLIGPEELARYMMTTTIFLGLPVLAHRFDHIRLDFLLEAVRTQTRRRRLVLLILVIELAFLVVFTKASYEVVLEAVQNGQRSPGLGIPLFWPLLAILIGAATAAVVTALMIFRQLVEQPPNHPPPDDQLASHRAENRANDGGN